MFMYQVVVEKILAYGMLPEVDSTKMPAYFN
jgi:hypothetical protein